MVSELCRRFCCYFLALPYRLFLMDPEECQHGEYNNDLPDQVDDTVHGQDLRREKGHFLAWDCQTKTVGAGLCSAEKEEPGQLEPQLALPTVLLRQQGAGLS